jgi:hypothetical protein
MAKYCINVFHLTKLGFLVSKYTIWQPCSKPLNLKRPSFKDQFANCTSETNLQNSLVLGFGKIIF